MNEPIIATGVDSSVRELLDRSLLAQSLSLTPSYEVNYLSTALGMVECGLGVAILPETALRAGQEFSVRIAEIEQPMLKRSINLIRRKSSPYSSAAEKLVSALRLAASKTKKRTIKPHRRGSDK
jgi:LysR family transcriptional regulator, carnitine catabolism transcriptional activator